MRTDYVSAVTIDWEKTQFEIIELFLESQIVIHSTANYLERFQRNGQEIIDHFSIKDAFNIHKYQN